MKKRFTVRIAKKLSDSEIESLHALHKESCDGDDWIQSETDFTPVRVNGELGFDNGAGYIFTPDGSSFEYSDSDTKDNVFRWQATKTS